MGQVPDYKLAKIGQGKDKERRGAAAALPSAGAGAAKIGGAAAAGAGALAGTAATAAKVAVAVLMATMGVGAYKVGKSLAPDQAKFQVRSKFAAKKGAAEKAK